jgi:CTP synthase
MCDVDVKAVINAADAASIYDIPTVLNEQGLDDYIIKHLGLKANSVDWSRWQSVLDAVHEPKHHVTVAMVGKYIELPDAYLSVTEALRAGGFASSAKVNIKWVPSDACETEAGAREQLGDVDAVLVPGGFGVRGIEGKLGALRFARENRIPTLGICLGLQCMVIEYSRNILGLAGASSTEFDPDTKHPVIATMAEQVAILESGDMGGTMRLGSYTASLKSGSIVEQLYGASTSQERHRHRYEVNNSYRDDLSAAGLVFSGTSPDGHLVEYVELPSDVHPFYVATQAHPEFKSRPTHAHPLFRGLIEAALERQEASRLFEVEADA